MSKLNLLSTESVSTYKKFNLNDGNLYINNSRVGFEEFNGGKNIDISNHMFNLTDNIDLSGSLHVDGNTVLKDVTAYNLDLTTKLACQYLKVNDFAQIGIFEQIGTIDGISSEEFGYSIALSSDGTILAVGSRFTDLSGSVSIYKYDINWTSIGTIYGTDITHFGSSIALNYDGTIMAVSARSTTSSVSIYQYDQSDWNTIGTIYANEFGFSVSLSSDGTILAVGARLNPFGSVSVYKYDQSSWNQLGTFNETVDQFGLSVALSSDGTILAVGSRFSAVSGSVSIYKYDTNWTSIGTIDGNTFTVSLSSDGTILAVGGISDQAYVKIYEYKTGWNQLGDTIYLVDGYQGFSISLNNKRIAIGSPYENNSGHIQIYEYKTNWIQMLDFYGDIESGFGRSISLTDTTLAVGSINIGQVSIYELTLGEMRIYGKMDLSGTLNVVGQSTFDTISADVMNLDTLYTSNINFYDGGNIISLNYTNIGELNNTTRTFYAEPTYTENEIIWNFNNPIEQCNCYLEFDTEIYGTLSEGTEITLSSGSNSKTYNQIYSRIRYIILDPGFSGIVQFTLSHSGDITVDHMASIKITKNANE